MLSGPDAPPFVIALLHPGHVFRPHRRNEMREHRAFRMTFGQRCSHRKDPLHPRRGPRAVCWEQSLHVEAKMDGARGQRRDQRSIIPLKTCSATTRKAY